MSDSLPLVRVLESKYPVLYQKSNCDNFDDEEEVVSSSISCMLYPAVMRRSIIMNLALSVTCPLVPAV